MVLLLAGCSAQPSPTDRLLQQSNEYWFISANGASPIERCEQAKRTRAAAADKGDAGSYRFWGYYVREDCAAARTEN